MTRREFSKTSNEKGLLKNDNARSGKNIVIYTNISSSFLYSHNIKHNSIVSKAVRAKRIKVFHTRKVNTILLATDVITKKDNIYDNYRDIYNLDHLMHGHKFHEAISENAETNPKRWNFQD